MSRNMIPYPVRYFDDEDEMDSIDKLAYKKHNLKALFEDKEFPRVVYTMSRMDFLELLAYWNKSARGWKYIETD